MASLVEMGTTETSPTKIITIYIWRLLVKQPLTPPQCIFGDVNEATPDSARPNRHPSSRTDVSSIPATSELSNLTPPLTVTKSKGAKPPIGEEEEEEFPV
jgi:hypothetical protein